MSVAGNLSFFALPPIPIELLNYLLENGPLIKSSIAEFVHQKKIEPAGESFFYKYEGGRCKKTNFLNKSELKSEGFVFQCEDNLKNKFKRKSLTNKSNINSNTGIVTLARLRELVAQEETLYDKLGITECAGIKEIKQAYRKLALSYHPDKRNENNCFNDTSENFLKIQEAYEILSDNNLRHKYDSALPFDESIPTIYSNNDSFEDFKQFFFPIFNKYSRWSLYKPVPDLGEKDDNIEIVEKFYEFWRCFQSNRDFSIHDEYELNQAESREEKRWMERQNAKIRSKYMKLEISRISKFVELAYKHDPRIKLHYDYMNKLKENERRKKEEEKKNREEEERLKKKEEERRNNELKLEMKSLRASIRNYMRKISDIEHFFNNFQTEDHYFSDGIEIIKEYSNWEDEFLNSILVSHNDRIHNEYLFSKLNFKQWEDWLLKINNQELKKLDVFLYKWLETYGEMCKSRELMNKLYIIYCLRISSLKEIDITKIKKELHFFSNGSANLSKFQEEKSNLVSKNNSEWTVSELSLLAKALQKYPRGFKNRWDMISEFLKNIKTKEQIICKVREISESDKVANLSNEVKHESPFNDFILNNKGVLKKCGNTPDIRDSADIPNLRSGCDRRDSANAENDVWTKEQQAALESALKKYSSFPAKERWNLISASVPNKTASQCIARFKFIRDQIINRQKQ